MPDAAGAAMNKDFLPSANMGSVDKPPHAVMKMSGSAAASRMPRFFGFGASNLSSTATNSASDPCRPPTPPVIP